VSLTAMGWSARDAVRGARHERFELMHRFVGWSVLGVLVAVVAHRFAVDLAAGAVPAALLLAAVVGVVAQPWTSVRRLPVEVLVVTPGLVVLAMPGRRRVGEFVRVSLEGREWHAFAVSTCGREGADRFCLVIRRAGDWTEQLGRSCENGTPPTWLQVRTLRGYGFMGAAQAYRQVLVVATGAGIGPVLLYLLDRRQPGLHCVWIARDPRSSIGADLVDRVLAGAQTILVDTSDARPDLAQLVTAAAVGVEAVFVVGNATARDQVAAVCSDLGVRWYGPTFDS
jgi:predicted ferric reductase